MELDLQLDGLSAGVPAPRSPGVGQPATLRPRASDVDINHRLLAALSGSDHGSHALAVSVSSGG